jgi:mRNA interferase HigB
VEVRGIGVIAKFQRKHSNARKPLAEWLAKVNAAQWNNLEDMKKTFKSVDYVAPVYIFDVGGNNFRVIALVAFIGKTVIVDKVLTHAEYDRWKPR